MTTIPKKQEIYDDLHRLLSVLMEWHDNVSCLCDIVEACKIANKYGFRIEFKALDLLRYGDYDLSKEDLAILRRNQAML